MKKILIITEVFPPAFNPRMGYLAKYLPAYGWDADIITHNTNKDNNFGFLVGSNKIVRVNLKHTGTPGGFLQSTWYILNSRRHFLSDRKPFLKGIRENFRKEDYSAILVSVSWDLFVLEAGLTMSKKWNIPLLVDLRDIHEQKPCWVDIEDKSLKSLFLNHFNGLLQETKIKLRNRVLKNASAVISVSPFHVETLSKYNKDVSLIYNGFDPDLFYPRNPEKASTFTILYPGLIFTENIQNPTLLFEAVNRLEQEHVIDRERFRIQFYTPPASRSELWNNKLYPVVEKYIDFFDYVGFQDVPGLLHKCSIALVLSNIADENGPKGVLTTKFYDYLGAERPVLCVRSDEGILEDTIRKANVGVAARTADEAYHFILKKWNEWNENGFTTVMVNQDFKQQFSRKNQAKQFAGIFERVTKQAICQ
jgi:glycosyltransferase involved in cell wall biosynthesis